MNNSLWQKSPHLLEDKYTFEDARMVGLMPIALLPVIKSPVHNTAKHGEITDGKLRLL